MRLCHGGSPVFGDGPGRPSPAPGICLEGRHRNAKGAATAVTEVALAARDSPCLLFDAARLDADVALRPGSNATLPDLALGARLRSLPNHAGATAAQHDCHHVRDTAGRSDATWPRPARAVVPVPKLRHGYRVEIEAIAARPDPA